MATNSSQPENKTTGFRIEGIDHVALTVRDLEASIAWYQEVLGLERPHNAWNNNPAVLCAGDTCVALFAARTDNPAETPDIYTTIVMKHLAFRVDRPNFEAAQTTLRARGIDFKFADHDISHSIYFNDLSGHLLEITTYDV
jgi:catechol 2,3-dioxygenase-like lactoylglutathione lyase family enzyme